RDQNEVRYGNAGFDQLDPGGPRVDKDPVPTFTDEQLDGLRRGVHLEQLGILHLATSRPPAREALLRIEIEQRDPSALFRSAHSQRACESRFADTSFRGCQRDNTQSIRLRSHRGTLILRGEATTRDFK